MSDPIYYQVRCSECGFDLDPQTFGEELKKYGADRFCPKCGAKMDVLDNNVGEMGGEQE
jgi:DNA-directed RNA polymerase subunit RPC12/RpoP